MAQTKYLDYAGLQELVRQIKAADKVVKDYAGNITGKKNAQGVDYTSVQAYLEDEIAKAAKAGSAENVSVTDTADHFTGTNVETILAELAVAIELLNDTDATKAGTIAKMIADEVGELKIGDTTYTTVKAYVDAMCVAVKKLFDATTGDLTNLKTTAKTDVVSAINEVSDAVKAVDYSGKADKVTGATNGNLAGLDANGNLTDSGKKAADFEVAGAAKAVQGETTKTVKEVVDEIGTKKVTGDTPADATGMYKYIDDAVAGVDSTTANKITISTTDTTEGYLKSYTIYQGGNADANKVAVIDIPKDLVVSAGEVVVDPEGQAAGTYIKLTIANQDSPLYINVKDLVDVYTAQASATQVQVAISETNEVSATIVAGSVTATELAQAVKDDIAKGQTALDKIGDATTGLTKRIEDLETKADAVDYSGKADKVSGATANNFAGLDANGNLIDSGKKAADFETAGAAKAVQGETTSTVKAVEDKVGTGYAIGGVDATVKSYIDSRIFVGSQAEVDAAKVAKTIDDSTFVVVTDEDAMEIGTIETSSITALFA